MAAASVTSSAKTTSPWIDASFPPAKEGLLGSCGLSQDKGENSLKWAQGKLIHKTNIYGASVRRRAAAAAQRQGLLSWFIRSWSPPGGWQGAELEGELCKGQLALRNKVNIAPDVCPGVEAINSSLPAHFIFQN